VHFSETDPLFIAHESRWNQEKQVKEKQMRYIPERILTLLFLCGIIVFEQRGVTCVKETNPDENPGKAEVFGFNTEIPVQGMIYHVQTESSDDQGNPTISTLIYHRGFLIQKISSAYSDIFADADMQDRLKERVRKQHFEAVERVKRGEYLGRSSP
jgi:hypothetical protein